MIDLRPDHLEIVRDLLRQHVPGCEVRAFGSRFKWTAKQASDLDLAVVGTKRLPTKKIMRLKEAFEESILPMRVDVLDWHAITPEFQRVIDAGFEVIQEGGEVSPLATASSPSAAVSSATPLQNKAFNSSRSWRTIRLSETTKFIVDNRGKTVPTTATGIPLIATNCINNHSLYPSYDRPRYISKHTYDTWFRSHPKPGDIILTTKGSQNGAVCLVPNPVDFVIAQDMVALRANESVIDPLYLLAILRAPETQAQIKNLDVSGVIPHFKKSDFDKLILPLPDMETQSFIGRIFFQLSERVELYRRINETLESMARTLFKDWFIDFGPVRAKMEGRDPYLSFDVWSLFPDRLVDTELGEIPDSWTCATLKDLTVKIGSGSTPRGGSEVYIDSGISLIRSQNVYDSNFVWDGLAYITDSAADQLKNVTLELEDVLINITGASILRTCVVEPATLPARVNQHVAIIRAKPEIPSRYLHLHLLQKSTKDYLMGMNAGASREAVTKAHLESTPIIRPSDKILTEFKKSTATLFNQIQQSNDSIRMLTSLRDNLLPKLLSGELSIPEAMLQAQVLG